MATFERHEGRNLKGIDPDAKDRDLEQYGVWVKAEPQDVLEEPDSEEPSLLSEAAEAAPVLDESFLTDEEEDFLGAGDGSRGKRAGEDGNAFRATSEIPSLQEEDLSIPDLEEVSPDGQDDLPRIPDMAEFESLEDLGVPIEEFTPEAAVPRSGSSRAPTEFQDVSDFGLEEAEPVLEAGTETDFESLDIDLTFDDTLPPRPAAQGGKVDRSPPPGDSGFETVTDFDDFLNNPESPAPADSESFERPAPPKPAPSAPAARDEEFSLEDIPELPREAPIDDLAELERDLAGTSGRLAAAPSASDASADILLKIAGELSSIKEELVSLKSQIAAMKSAGLSPSGEVEAVRKAEGGKAGGFFDEEEDETIALTGDELDNILNTAEFSEENADLAGAHEGTEPLEGFGDLLPETGEYAADTSGGRPVERAGIEEFRLPSEDGPASAVSIPPADRSIAALAEEGVAPLTPPPEDTSYLEEAEELQLIGEEELPEAPLLEPSPEELDIDDLVEERFEDAEELPLAEFEPADGLEEPADLDGDTEELEELTLELDSEPAPLVLETPDNIELPMAGIDETASGAGNFVPEFVEELPAEEDSGGFGEIALHHEETPEAMAEDLLEVMDLEPAGESKEPGLSPESESLLVEELEADEPSKPEPIPNRIKDEVRSVLTYLDKLLESLPEEKIEEFAKSEHFETYKRLFEELGLV